jgi:predicted dehydrogenase
MNRAVTIALVGIGGHGNYYLDHLFQAPAEYPFRLVAGIDPSPSHCRYLERLHKEKIPIYADASQFYAEGSADLVIIAAPIHSHAALTCQALAHGAHVLCEKPVAATVQDAYAMLNAEIRTQRFTAIGYQWSFSDAIQALKRDMLAGEFGCPLRMKTKVFWPRLRKYFYRADWAGKQKASDGRWILDSPVNNAAAHYLHNMLYLLGSTRESSAWPVDIQAELYRANTTENYDAAALRCHTEEGAEILFYTAHCVSVNIGPVFNYEFEDAVVEFDGSQHNPDVTIRAHFRKGETREYGDPDATHFNKLGQSMKAVYTGAPIACGVKASIPQIVCANGAQESMPEITDMPEALLKTKDLGEDYLIWIDGLREVFEACYDQGLLPSEMEGISWARPGKILDLREYRSFPSFRDGE